MIKDRFVLIDAFALIYRAYHALPAFIDKKGRPVGVVYGFASALLASIKELHPEYLAVGIDRGKPHRLEEYKEYKIHRPPTPDDIVKQVPLVMELLETFNIPVVFKEGYEGEDVIATVVANVKARNSNVKTLEFIIVTGDLDCLQLVDEETKVYSMARGINQATMYDIDKVKKRYGLLPSQLVDFKALKGDPSDNIPGVPGIGEKGAAKLIIEYKNLENIYKNIEKISNKLQTILIENKDQAFLSRKLSKIVDNIDIDFTLSSAKVHDYDQEKIIKLFEEHGFKSLIKRLPDEHREELQQKLL